MTNIQDIIQISEFKRNTKVFLDAARKQPLLVRRGMEIFEIRSKPIRLTVEGSKQEIAPLDPPEFGGMPQEDFMQNAKRTSFPSLKPTEIAQQNNWQATSGMPSGESFEPVVEPFEGSI